MVADATSNHRAGQFLAAAAGTFYLKIMGDGTEQAIRLSNFVATITADIGCDDGLESTREYEIEVHLKGHTIRLRVPARRFGSFDWVAERVGASAYLTAAPSCEKRLREAIPVLSGEIPVRTVYVHTGWIRLAGQWVYLHIGGGIGANGLVTDVEVELPRELRHFVLPEPPKGATLQTAVVAAIDLVNLAPDRIAAPCFCGPWRAVLGSVDFTLSLVGPTAVFKTEIAALEQAHFGPGLNARSLPGSWSSTANFLRLQAFLTKDGLLTIDDFVPNGTRIDSAKKHREAEALLRDVGNASGRGRLASDASSRPVKMPRCMPITTGEERFRGESLQGRMFTIEISKADIDQQRLTTAQGHASKGQYALAMSAFLQWLAPQLDDVRAEMRTGVLEFRTQAAVQLVNAHGRTPGIVADLYFGARLFFRFAVEVGALPQHLADSFLDRIWSGLIEAASEQASHIREHEPTQRFLTLLRSAVSSGSAHLTDDRGSEPFDRIACGWRQAIDFRWLPQGMHVGWIDNDQVFLDRDVALKAANSIAADGAGINISASTLSKRLHEKGLLASTGTDRGRSTLTILKTLSGVRRDVLHLKLSTLFPVDEASVDNTIASHNGVAK